MITVLDTDTVPLEDYEVDVECVWGDYPGTRMGQGKYVDLHKNGLPIGRLWGSATTVGLLHLPYLDDDDYETQREIDINHWNAAAEIRKAKHDGLSATAAFDLVAANHDHGPVVEGANLQHINFPEVDEKFYRGRYNPYDSENWCEEMQ